jgi:hypothetical protein
MGSPDAFERRRAELELLGGAAGGRVRDADVLASFREAVGPAGLMRGYIEHGHLAVVLGNTLFVHGAVCDRSMGFVPAGSGGRSSGEEAERGPDDDSGPREWAEKLQIWKEEQVAEWIRWGGCSPQIRHSLYASVWAGVYLCARRVFLSGTTIRREAAAPGTHTSTRGAAGGEARRSWTTRCLGALMAAGWCTVSLTQVRRSELWID